MDRLAILRPRVVRDSATALFVGAGAVILLAGIVGLASGARHAIDRSPTTPNLEGGPA